ncbi:MAG: energy-coupling factor transporter ATPase [Candidatus Fimisoma sp.]|nr:energy-coupling factor transporter ATPase [Bacillota bacterium]MDD7285162.1 energy-coupling factor transporter ATPase [Bacillota bacterium]MDY4748938.1 energy-coupling factor transporter ATPase [Candidatus Fimisoma sp.]
MSIQVKNLKHIYEKGMPTESVALEGVSFEVEDGELLGIIGHTGSGKSTLLQHLNGLLKPDEGTIVIGGVDITAPGVSMVEIRKRIGLVFQYPEYQLFEETVAKDVAFGPRNLGLADSEIEERVREALELVGLDYEDMKDRSPFELSGGQKRRVAIAGVIAMRPEVLILDEPTAGLDPKAHKDVLKMIEDVHGKTGNITVLVSHNMADIANLSDKVLVIDSGRVVTMGTPEEVFSKRDELSSVGLDLPPITCLTEALRERGFKIRETILSVEDAADEIAEYLKAGGKAEC